MEQFPTDPLQEANATVDLLLYCVRNRYKGALVSTAQSPGKTLSDQGSHVDVARFVGTLSNAPARTRGLWAADKRLTDVSSDIDRLIGEVFYEFLSEAILVGNYTVRPNGRGNQLCGFDVVGPHFK